MRSPVRLDGSNISWPTWYEGWDATIGWVVWGAVAFPFLVIFVTWLVLLAPFWLLLKAAQRVRTWSR